MAQQMDSLVGIPKDENIDQDEKIEKNEESPEIFDKKKDRKLVNVDKNQVKYNFSFI